MTVLQLLWWSIPLDVCVGVIVLTVRVSRSPRPAFRFAERIGLARVAAVGGVLGVVQVLKLQILHALGLNIFGVMRLAYVGAVVTIPAIGLILLLIWACARRRVSAPARVLAALSLLAIPAGIYGTFIEPYRLKLEQTHVPLAKNRGGRDPIRVGVLADVQTSHVADHERHAVEMLLAQKPDIILIPGDLWQGTRAELDRELPALRELLCRLACPGGVYYVHGNCDAFPEMRNVLAGTPVRVLENEVVHVRVRDRRLTIGGINPWSGSGPDAIVRTIETDLDADDIRLLVAHFPDMVAMLRADSRVDLLVAGHTHGGQIVLPSFGPLMTFSQVPREVAAGGLHSPNNKRIYVSRGVGWERGQAPRIRFLCPPEVTLLTLE